MKNQELMLLGIGIAVIWIVQQNQIYQAQAQKLTDAAAPVGHLAGTVEQYVPELLTAATAWINRS